MSCYTEFYPGQVVKIKDEIRRFGFETLATYEKKTEYVGKTMMIRRAYCEMSMSPYENGELQTKKLVGYFHQDDVLSVLRKPERELSLSFPGGKISAREWYGLDSPTISIRYVRDGQEDWQGEELCRIYGRNINPDRIYYALSSQRFSLTATMMDETHHVYSFYSHFGDVPVGKIGKGSLRVRAENCYLGAELMEDGDGIQLYCQIKGSSFKKIICSVKYCGEKSPYFFLKEGDCISDFRYLTNFVKEKICF